MKEVEACLSKVQAVRHLEKLVKHSNTSLGYVSLAAKNVYFFNRIYLEHLMLPLQAPDFVLEAVIGY